MSRRTVHADDPADRWRYTCPVGHRRWEPAVDHFWCPECARRDVDTATFPALRDRETGERLPRPVVRVVAAPRHVDESRVAADRIGPVEFDRLDDGSTRRAPDP